MRAIEKVCARRKNSFWLKLKLRSAKVERKIGKAFPMLDEKIFLEFGRELMRC